STLTESQKYALINATRTLGVPLTKELQKGWDDLMEMGLVALCHCHWALQNQPLMGASKPARPLGLY
ncbi:MAG: hypothetical protein WCO09_03680, partial [bacterium]